MGGAHICFRTSVLRDGGVLGSWAKNFWRPRSIAKGKENLEDRLPAHHLILQLFHPAHSCVAKTARDTQLDKMQSIRRAALRSALSASRALPIKASSAPFASTIAKAATASKLVSIQSVRFYSQEPIEQAEQAEQASAEIQEASQEVSRENEVADSEEHSSAPPPPVGTHTLAPIPSRNFCSEQKLTIVY